MLLFPSSAVGSFKTCLFCSANPSFPFVFILEKGFWWVYFFFLFSKIQKWTTELYNWTPGMYIAPSLPVFSYQLNDWKLQLETVIDSHVCLLRLSALMAVPHSCCISLSQVSLCKASAQCPVHNTSHSALWSSMKLLFIGHWRAKSHPLVLNEAWGFWQG